MNIKMGRRNILLCFTLTVLYVNQIDSVLVKTVKPGTDSYLMALAASKATDPAFSNKNRREDSYPVYNAPDTSSESGYEYTPPPTNYGSPVNSYGTPATNYGAPTSSYGTPTIDAPPSTYGGPYHKPSVPSSYGPPSYNAPMYLPAPHYIPYGPPAEESSKGGSFEKWLLHKLKFKLDLYTVGKILLKLVIFKKIVKFIALICLLLFIPTLKKKFGMNDKDQDSDESDEERILKRANASTITGRKLNDLTVMVTRAIETFAIQATICTDDDPSPECKFNSIYNRLHSIDHNESISISSSDSKEVAASDSGESEETFKNATNEVNEI